MAPGINSRYLQESVNVEEWVGRLERADREVYAKREEIVRQCSILRGATVADIGAGTGAFTIPLAKAVGPKGKVYAVDIVPEFLLHIRKRLATEGISNVEPVLCSERSLSLPPNSIDLAFLCDVYHHFEYPKSTLLSLRRAMRPGGSVVVIDFRRVPGQSSEWVMNHVRAGQEVVVKEFQEMGFDKVEEKNFLKENYFLRFEKVDL